MFSAGRVGVVVPITVTTVVPIPQISDVSTNAPANGALYSHAQISGLAATNNATVAFDSISGSFVVTGVVGGIIAIPPDAKTISVTPTAACVLQFGRNR